MEVNGGLQDASVDPLSALPRAQKISSAEGADPALWAYIAETLDSHVYTDHSQLPEHDPAYPLDPKVPYFVHRSIKSVRTGDWMRALKRDLKKVDP